MSGTTVQPDMRPVRFATQSAQLDATGGSHERLVNLYAEPAPAGSPSDLILRHVPGLNAILSIGLGPIRDINPAPSGTFVMSGSHVYLLSAPNGVFTVQDLGDVGLPAATSPNAVTNFVSSAGAASVYVICVPPYAYAVKAGDAAVHKIVGTDAGPFPVVRSVAYLGGFFAFSIPDTSEWFVSGALDPDTYNALDFAYADANPNILLRIVSHLDRLWLFGQGGIEIWYLSGDADFPFRLDAGGIIDESVLSGQSIEICDGSLFWLSNDGVVFRTSGYKAVRVSTHAVEAQIQQYFLSAGIDEAASVLPAVSYTYEGHECYALTLKGPNDPGRTWVYDCSTNLWFERSSSATGDGRWRVSCAGQKSLYLGDCVTGHVYVHDDTFPQDWDQPAARIAVSAPVWNSTARLFMSRFEVDCQHTALPITLDWSDDDAQTWSASRTMLRSGGRCYTTRMGSTRRRTLRMQVASGPVRIYGTYALIDGGAS